MTSQPEPHLDAPADPEHDPRATFALDPALARRLTARVVASSDEARTTYAPFTGQPLARLPISSPADVETAATRARPRNSGGAALHSRARPGAAPPPRPRPRPPGRGARPDPAGDRQGPPARARGGRAVAVAARHYGRTAAALPRHPKRHRRRPGAHQGRRAPRPQGVVGTSRPWNYPLELAVGDALPAFVAGNAVVMKPDTGDRADRAVGASSCCIEAGLPAGRLAGRARRGPGRRPEVVEHADYVSFTGSTRTGREVAAAARPPGWSAAPSNSAARTPCWCCTTPTSTRRPRARSAACFSSAGQLCISIERLYVHESVADAFVERFVGPDEGDAARRRPSPTAPTWARWSAKAQLETVTAHVEDAVAKGATVLAGGRPAPTSARSSTSRPSSTASRPGWRCCAEETFGPVVSIYRFRDERRGGRAGQRHAVRPERQRLDPGRRARPRASPRGCAAGTVNVNEGYARAYGSVDAPMGGMKDSGLGRRHGSEGILKYTEAQTVAQQRLTADRRRSSAMTDEKLRRRRMTRCVLPACCRGSAAAAHDDSLRLRRHRRRLGFGGSVSALRLTEKGYRVGVLEAGRRFDERRSQELLGPARTTCGRPRSGCYGIQRIHLLSNVHGAGRRRRRRRLAGLRQHPLRAADAVLRRPAVGDITDWQDELAPYYDQAKRMLGVDH